MSTSNVLPLSSNAPGLKPLALKKAKQTELRAKIATALDICRIALRYNAITNRVDNPNLVKAFGIAADAWLLSYSNGEALPPNVLESLEKIRQKIALFSLVTPRCEMSKAMAMVLQAITTNHHRDKSASAAAYKALRLIDEEERTPGSDRRRETRVVMIQLFVEQRVGKLPSEIEDAMNRVAGFPREGATK